MKKSQFAPLFLALSPLTLASDWNVDPTSDLQAVADMAADGDRIVFAAGTYNQTFDIDGKALELVNGSTPGSVILDGSGLDDSILRIDGAAALVTVRGLTFTQGVGAPVPSSWGQDHYGGGMRIDAQATVLIEDCWFHDNGWGDGSNAGSCTFGGAFFAGSTGTSVTARRCTMTQNRAWASGGATMGAGGAYVLLENCTYVDNVSTNFLGNQGGHGLHVGSHVDVRNCIFRGNTGTQVGCFQGYCGGTSSDIRYTNIQGGAPGAGNIDADPLFVNPGGFDFSLAPGSPSIDAGDPASGLDCAGTPVDQGAVGPLCTTFGEVYCDSNPNSTGATTVIVASGSQSAGANDLTLSVLGLPTYEYGYFVTSQVQGYTPNFGGSLGVLCLGAPMIRFNIPSNGGQVLNSGASGSVAFSPDLSLLPNGQTVLPGETWNFQYWHRDFVGGVQVSTTSSGLAIQFQ